MNSDSSPSPRFGEADLSNCEREQIHLAGGIQPHGFLLSVREPDLTIVQASANAAERLGLDKLPIGLALGELPGDITAHVQEHLNDALHEIPNAFRCRTGQPLSDFDCLIHRPATGGILLEIEAAGEHLDLAGELDRGLDAIRSASSLDDLCNQTVKIFKRLAGYDRAMLYEFDEEGHGEVLAEEREAKLESYLGQHYPASDIPQIARRLYQRNRVRVLVDVDDERIPLEPRLSPLDSADLDMSLCFLRAMSPIHIQYLKNMGVRATLVASLVVGDQLWGLVACHHYSRKLVQYEIRAACELLAEAVSTRIAALESFAQAQAELSVRQLEQRMAQVIARDGDWRTALFDRSNSLLEPVRATGAAMLLEDEVASIGEVPGTTELRRIGEWLDGQERAPVRATTSLGSDSRDFEAISGVASGLVATPLSTGRGEYLMWFRPAQDRTVTWGGNPYKPYVIGNDPADLSPRRSFAQWHQQVEGTSESWTPADLAAAKLLGETVSDVILQFRSVRVLIAQDQLETLRRRVQDSEHPVVIANPGGRILLTNESFERLLSAGHPHLEWIADLPSVFESSAEIRQRLQELVGSNRSFRGDFGLRSRTGDIQPLALRGDPVLAAPDRVLGYVIFGSDLSERRAVETARERFQAALVEDFPLRASAALTEPEYQRVLNAVLGNARLAVLEITDGIDPGRMPRMLEGVHSSVGRTAELLDHLAALAGQRSKTK